MAACASLRNAFNGSCGVARDRGLGDRNRIRINIDLQSDVENKVFRDFFCSLIHDLCKETTDLALSLRSIYEARVFQHGDFLCIVDFCCRTSHCHAAISIYKTIRLISNRGFDGSMNTIPFSIRIFCNIRSQICIGIEADHLIGRNVRNEGLNVVRFLLCRGDVPN